jgi:hypothetical protein
MTADANLDAPVDPPPGSPSKAPAPRVFCIPATEAPVLAVLRRGPSSWFHVGRWTLEPPSFQAGAWFRGQIYPQKCDLSPDGRWLLYSALDGRATWPAGTTYEAVSRLPWLHALAAWNAGTTYTRGLRFVARSEGIDVGDPDVGDPAALLRRWGLAPNLAEQFCVERRRGWTEAADSEPRHPSDAWDERRRARMEKARPGGGWTLRLGGAHAAFRDGPHAHDPPAYALESAHDVHPLEGVQWADWDARGRLLLVTAGARLAIHDDPGRLGAPAWEHDLSAYRPAPEPAPAWARSW